MSTGRPETRAGILDAARRLFEERGTPDVELEEIAREAGVSRQAIYLHFGRRTNLLVALAEHVDSSERLDELASGVHRARTGAQELDEFIRFHADYIPRIHAIATAFDEARRQDEAAAAVWADRMRAQQGACRRIVERLRREQTLAAGWSVGDAADLLWTLTSIRTWEQLVLDQGWSRERYVKRIGATARRTLVAAKS
jgi:AcrR family transcriptional regulator